MSDHPHDLLAQYVDGDLDPGDQDRVERHLASCADCRGEVRAARDAREALSRLPEVEEPEGMTLDVLRRAREEGRPRRPWVPKAVAAAAAAVIVFGGGGYLLVQLGGDGDETADRAAAPQEEAAEGDPATGGTATLAGIPYPAVRETDADYDGDGIRGLAAQLAADARGALEAGFPPTAFEFYESFDPDAAPRPLRRALRCVGEGLAPDRSVVPLVVELARFEGTLAYVASFLGGPDPGAPYDRLQILVVDRETCGLLHFARQRL